MAGTCGYGEGLSGSINAGNFLTSCKVYWLASQEGLCSMEEVSKYVSKYAAMTKHCKVHYCVLPVFPPIITNKTIIDILKKVTIFLGGKNMET